MPAVITNNSETILTKESIFEITLNLRTFISDPFKSIIITSREKTNYHKDGAIEKNLSESSLHLTTNSGINFPIPLGSTILLNSQENSVLIETTQDILKLYKLKKK